MQILGNIERDIAMDKFLDAFHFVNQAIVQHLASLDIIPLLHTLIRICSLLIDTMERGSKMCSQVLYHLTYALTSAKVSKKLAPLFFDLILAELGMRAMEAPYYAQQILTKSEFYPWKELTSRIADFVRICGSYDSIIHKDYFTKLDELEKILALIHDRAKINPIILRATHEPALKAIFRWSEKNTKYSMHVYKMGHPMLELLDPEQITLDICSKFIDALGHRVNPDDDDDDRENVRLRNTLLFMVSSNFFLRSTYFISFEKPMSARLAKFIERFKTLPHALHQQLASFFMATLDRPFFTENGTRKFEYTAMSNLWHKVGPCLVDESDALVYDSCLERLYTRAQEDDDKDLHDWWITFWTTVGMKLPQVAADHVEQFLITTIDRKDMSLLSLLPVSTCFKNM
jgi:hypothetical protein